MRVVVGYQDGRKVYADLGPGGGHPRARGPVHAYGSGGVIVVGASGSYTVRREKLKGYKAAHRDRQRAKAS